MTEADQATHGLPVFYYADYTITIKDEKIADVKVG